MGRKTYKYHFIYHIRILVGSFKDYFYVGLHSTNNIDDGYCGSGKRVSDIINSYKKRGYKDNEIYERTILTFATSRAEVIELEAMYVDKNILLNEYSLNEKTGGEQCVEYSDEMCAKISKGRKGKLVGENNPAKRADTRAKISKANKGRKPSDDARAKMSKGRKGKLVGENNPMYGKKPQDFMTSEEIEEMNKNISIALLKYYAENPEVRVLLSEKFAGENNPAKRADVRMKISNTKKGRKPSDDARAKMSKAKKGKPSTFKGKHHSDDSRKKCGTKNKGMKPVNNGIICKKIHESKIDEFLANNPGWVRGMLKKKSANMKGKNKGKKPVNNGIICKKIHESKIDEFLANNPGWVRGMIKRKKSADEIKEWGRKISEKNSGKNNPMFGKNPEDFMSEEAIKEKRRKQSEKNKGKNKGKHPYNNGEIEIRRRDDEVIPDGFVRGTLKKSA